MESCAKLTNFSPKSSDTAQEANLSLASTSAGAAVTKEQRDGKMKADDKEGISLLQPQKEPVPAAEDSTE